MPECLEKFPYGGVVFIVVGAKIETEKKLKDIFQSFEEKLIRVIISLCLLFSIK